MQIRLGKQLREHRSRSGMTQEMLGEALGVSAQAISRWENNTACPDAMTLAALSMLYGVSTDALLGLEEWHSRDKLNSIHRDVQHMVAQGDAQAAEALLRDSLRIYPNNSGLMLALAETLAHSDQEEAIALGERVLQCTDLSMKARSTAVVNLLLLYRSTGRQDKASALLRELPHMWESREMMAAEVAADRRTALRKAVANTLALLCRKISDLSDEGVPDYVQLGMENSFSEPEVMLEEIKRFLQA